MADQVKGHNAAILVIDDEEVVHSSMRRVLTRRGYRVEAVLSAKEGLEKLRRKVPDLVITDLMMPEMNGIELLQSLYQEGIQVPVIMVTGYPTISTAVKAMRLGARDYISKPFTRMELLGPVLRALRHDEETDQEGASSPQQIPSRSTIEPDAVVLLCNHSWARYQQDGLFQIGVEQSFLGAVGQVTRIITPEEGELVEQGAFGIKLTNQDGEEHRVAMPFTGQIMCFNEEAIEEPGQLDETKWIMKVLPSNLDSELKNLQHKNP
jgi:FixJ family two-component response regulator/glycine cleavage system H lipoate-binding protein